MVPDQTWWVWVMPVFIELMPDEPEAIGAIPEDDACVESDFVAIVPEAPVEVLLFGTVEEPVLALAIGVSLEELAVPFT